MRRIFLFTMLVFLTGVASARRISEKEARGIAASKVSALQSAARVQSKCVAAEDGALAPVYIFSAPNGGFAIVAGDDRMPDMVLAYSDFDAFDYDNAPSAMRAWLDEVSEYIKAGDFSNVRRPTLDYSKPVAPMITTKWDQMAPYNDMVPLGPTGERCPTGCIATATAQVMNFWKYPTEGGIAPHSYEWNGQTLSVDFRESRYDWANMLDTYDDSASEEQRRAVAKLMYDLGVASDMYYAEDLSGTQTATIARGLIDFLGYNPGLRVCYRNLFTNDEWFSMVNGELEGGRPLVYCGCTTAQEGHAFVCDGYDGDGLYHINWGWGGMCDGYFDLNILDPARQGTGGSESGLSFSELQNIIIGLRPAREGDVADRGWVLWADDFVVEADKQNPTSFRISWTVTNLGYRPFEGELGISFWHENEPEEEQYMDVENFVGEKAIKFNDGNMLELILEGGEDLEDGVYYVRFMDKPLGSNELEEIGTPVDSRPFCFKIRDGKVEDLGRVDGVLNDGCDASVEYYNLQGVRIDNPVPGTFVIERRGNKAVRKMIR